MMKNPDLIVHGEPASHLVISDFTEALQMTDWELGKYDDEGVLISPGIYDVLNDKYGQSYCDDNKIDTMSDVFGQDFSDRFYKHKNKLIAKSSLNRLLKEREELDKSIDYYRNIIDS